jgi:hypothetical protein
VARRDPDELTPTEAALLALLAFGEKSGYDLARTFDRSIGLMWAPARGHIYAILPRLVEHGWATSREVVQAKRPNSRSTASRSRGGPPSGAGSSSRRNESRSETCSW